MTTNNLKETHLNSNLEQLDDRVIQLPNLTPATQFLVWQQIFILTNHGNKDKHLNHCLQFKNISNSQTNYIH